jgi:hypothetical protein
MIISIILNFFVLCVICVACDCVADPLVARCRQWVTRTDVARILCLVVFLEAFLARGIAGLIEVSPMLIIGPVYVDLTKWSQSVTLKGLVSEIWRNVKLTANRVIKTK